MGALRHRWYLLFSQHRSSPPTRDHPPEPKPSAAASSPTTLSDVATMWPAILEGLKSMSRVAWMVFSDSTPLSLDNGTLAVGVPE